VNFLPPHKRVGFRSRYIMKLDKQKEEIKTNIKNLTEIKFSVDNSESVVPLLIDFLSRLYSNPKQTLMFEYVSNAYDSHVAAGKEDTPVEITLPNKFSPYYCVRDFGVSMTHEEVENIFSVALRSTKRDTNATIGGYGVGKLVFAPYCGIMFLTTWRDGFKTIYQCRLKDGDGGIFPLSRVESDEPQGVEIKIPAHEEDHTYFHHQARYSYSFLKTKPIIKGVQLEYDLGYESIVDTDKFSLLIDNNLPKCPIVTIGGIPFTLNTSNIYSYYDNNERLILINRSNMILKFAVGEIDHTPSRDQLEYNDKTISAIKRRIEEFIEYSKTKISKDITSCESLHEARLLLTKLKGSKDATISNIIEYFGNDIKWNDQVIDIIFSSIKITEDFGGEFKVLNYNYSSDRLETKQVQNIVYDSTFYYVPKNITKQRASKRIKAHMIANPPAKKYAIAWYDINGNFNNFCDEYSIPKDHFINVEELPDPLPVKRLTSSNNSLVDKYTIDNPKTKVLIHNESIKYLNGADVWEETEFDIKNDSGVFVYVKYFKPECDDNQQRSVLDAVYRILCQTDYKTCIIGIRTSERSKVERANNNKLIHLDTYLEQIYNKLDKNILSYSYQVINKNKYNYDNCYESVEEKTNCGYIKYYTKQCKRVLNHNVIDDIKIKINLYKKLAFYLNKESKLDMMKGVKKSKTSKKIELTKNIIEKRYPLLNNFCNYDSYKFVEYVNALSYAKRNNVKI